VSSFENYIDLTKSDSDRLIDGLECRTEGYVSRLRRSRFSEYFTVTKDGFRTLVSYLAFPDSIERNQDLPGLRIFDSPGSALSLFSDRPQDF
jgi:hypothetical protein